jgi:uncharacterized membrane protein
MKNATSYPGHADHSVIVAGPVEQVFAWLDDQTRLARHMSKRSWKMGWGKMDVELDERRGRAVGSHIVLQGRVLGIRISLDEVVIEREPPLRKTWETVSEPRLLVIGSYRMAFELESIGTASKVRVTIEYQLPSNGLSRLLGLLFGAAYARWCVRQMAEDARRAFP